MIQERQNNLATLEIKSTNSTYMNADTLTAIEFLCCIRVFATLKDQSDITMRQVVSCANHNIIHSNQVLAECVIASGIYCANGLKRAILKSGQDSIELSKFADARFDELMSTCSQIYSPVTK